MTHHVRLTSHARRDRDRVLAWYDAEAEVVEIIAVLYHRQDPERLTNQLEPPLGD